MLGLLLAIGRLYRDSEMPVLASSASGPAAVAAAAVWSLPVGGDRRAVRAVARAGRHRIGDR
jgi:hypothetical protein